jgi:hypothetical protein
VNTREISHRPAIGTADKPTQTNPDFQHGDAPVTSKPQLHFTGQAKNAEKKNQYSDRIYRINMIKRVFIVLFKKQPIL